MAESEGMSDGEGAGLAAPKPWRRLPLVWVGDYWGREEDEESSGNEEEEEEEEEDFWEVRMPGAWIS